MAEHYVGRKFERGGLKNHLLEVADFQIDYWDSGGEKPPIVLVHGFGTSPTIQWFRQVQGLEPDSSGHCAQPFILREKQTNRHSAI